MGSILIKDTTREEREEIVRKSLAMNMMLDAVMIQLELIINFTLMGKKNFEN